MRKRSKNKNKIIGFSFVLIMAIALIVTFFTIKNKESVKTLVTAKANDIKKNSAFSLELDEKEKYPHYRIADVKWDNDKNQLSLFAYCGDMGGTNAYLSGTAHFSYGTLQVGKDKKVYATPVGDIQNPSSGGLNIYTKTKLKTLKDESQANQDKYLAKYKVPYTELGLDCYKYSGQYAYGCTYTYTFTGERKFSTSNPLYFHMDKDILANNDYKNGEYTRNLIKQDDSVKSYIGTGTIYVDTIAPSIETTGRISTTVENDSGASYSIKDGLRLCDINSTYTVEIGVSNSATEKPTSWKSYELSNSNSNFKDIVDDIDVKQADFSISSMNELISETVSNASTSENYYVWINDFRDAKGNIASAKKIDGPFKYNSATPQPTGSITIKSNDGNELNTANGMILDISEDSNQKTETVNATLTGITGTVKWISNDTTIATVSPSEGNSTTVTGVKRGTTTVTATVNDGTNEISKDFKVTVIEPKIILTPESVEINKGETDKVNYTTQDINNAVSLTTENSSVATINENGIISGIEAGNTVVKATGTAIGTGREITAQATVLVYSIGFDKDSCEIKTGDSEIINLIGNNLPADAIITWESEDENIARVEVSNDGKSATIIGVNPGSTYIIVRVNGEEVGRIPVTVTSSQVQPTLTLDKHSITNVKPGETVQIKATKTNTTDRIQWSSNDETVAKVNSNITYNGDIEEIVTIECLKAGNATITAKLTDSITDTATIEVKQEEQPVIPTLTLDSHAFTNRKPGTTVQVKATKTNTTNKIQWSSSNEAVAKVNSNITYNGDTEEIVTIECLKAGNATITAKLTDSISDTVTIEVKDEEQKPTLTLTPSAVEVEEGATQNVVAKINNGNGTEKITWVSANTNIATVEASSDGKTGTIKGINAGTTTVSVFIDGEKAGEIEVTVKAKENPIDPTVTITITNSMTIKKGNTAKISATVTGTTSSITWTSSNDKVATVDQNGVVTAVNVGTAIITAEVDGETATCNVTVENNAEDNANVTIETVSMTLYKGATKEIKAEVSDGTSKITWTSSNDKIATVDENGIVTAVGVGTAYITATLENGNSAVCTVNVIEREDNNNNNNNNNGNNNANNNNNKGNTTTNQLPTNVVDNTMAINKILPKTGISRIIIAVITIIVISQVVLFVKYRRYKDI